MGVYPCLCRYNVIDASGQAISGGGEGTRCDVLKIVIVNRHPKDAVGGSEIQCDVIANNLTEAGHDVVYVAPHGNPAQDYNTAYRVLPVEPSSAAIAGAVIREMPDVVYWRFNKYFFFNSVRKISARKIPVVFAVSHLNDTLVWSARDNPKQGIKSALKYLKQGLLNAYNHLGFRYVAAVTANNPDQTGLLAVKKQEFVPNTITEEEEAFSWPRPYIVWVSNIKPAKRPELYYKLAEELKDEGVDFLMVGNIQSDHYHWLSEKPDGAPNFYYLGPQSLRKINGILAQSLFLAHTCNPEGFPGIFIQSWLKGKPVITLGFDPGKYIELNGIGANAHEDWNDFVEQARRFIRNTGLRETTGENAKHFAAKQFSNVEAGKRLVDFIEDVVHG